VIPEELTAVILAAGDSRRMGTPKALLPLGEYTLLEYSLDRFASAGVRRRIVVLSRALASQIDSRRLGGTHTSINTAPGRGPFSSLVLALEACRDPLGQVAGVFVLPVDVPCADAKVLHAMAGAAEEPGLRAVVPVVHGRGGHPVLLTPAGSAAVAAAAGSAARLRLDVMLHGWGRSVRRLRVTDEDVLANLNDRAAYERFARSVERSRAASSRK
jgi:CTP:molybdopterin cytidylyltransferase MocA